MFNKVQISPRTTICFLLIVLATTLSLSVSTLFSGNSHAIPDWVYVADDDIDWENGFWRCSYYFDVIYTYTDPKTGLETMFIVSETGVGYSNHSQDQAFSNAQSAYDDHKNAVEGSGRNFVDKYAKNQDQDGDGRDCEFIEG